MALSTKVLLIGAGYIGGEILDLLLAEGYAVTALVRRQGHATELQAIGAATIIGSLEDESLLEQRVLDSDVVINCASSDHLPSVNAILNGVKRRVEGGNECIYIHTSGAGVLGDESKGAYTSTKVFQDDKADDIDALPDNAVHREVDLAILKIRRDLEKRAKIAIMIPPIIYGVGSRDRRLSIQLPTVARFALKHGFAGYVGAGLSTWSQVHITDLARGYIMLLRWLEQPDCDSIYANPYFFAENGEQLSWLDCAGVIGKALYDLGRIQDPEPKEIQEELFDDLFGKYTWQAIGSNARNKAVRLRGLGWYPHEKPLQASLIEDEIPVILQEGARNAGYSVQVVSGRGGNLH